MRSDLLKFLLEGLSSAVQLHKLCPCLRHGGHERQSRLRVKSRSHDRQEAFTEKSLCLQAFFDFRFGRPQIDFSLLFRLDLEVETLER